MPFFACLEGRDVITTSRTLRNLLPFRIGGSGVEFEFPGYCTLTVRFYSSTAAVDGELVRGDTVEASSWRIRLTITSHHQYYLIPVRRLPHCEKSATALYKYLLPALVYKYLLPALVQSRPKLRV